MEQQQIVNEIGRKFSEADQAEKMVEQGLKYSEHLRQSILKAASEGKLVPQDPDDEPADKLLERIKEERAKPKGEKDANRRRKNKLNQLELSNYVE
jgi:type I restriction enzyme S subunit